MIAAKLKYYSWMQKGLSLGLTELADNFGVPPSAKASIDVGLEIQDITTEIRQTFLLRGPADVIGMESSQVVRVEPKPNSQDFEPNYFPFIELASPEFPWLFTPARSGPENRLRPWIILVVVELQDGVEIKRSLSSSNSVLSFQSDASRLLPSLQDAYAWVHVQESVLDISTSVNIEERLKSSPASFLARIMCSIKLENNKAYTACLVPSFEAGRRAGLGLVVGDTGIEDAWTGTTNQLDLPVFYSWSFSTGKADFEALARRLIPYPLDETVGIHDLDIATPRGGLNTGDLDLIGLREQVLLSFQGVLTSPVAAPRKWSAEHKTVFQEKLETVLTVAAEESEETASYQAIEDDPVVIPPVYGTWQTQLSHPKSRKDFHKWMDDINMYPPHRSVSGLATQVIRKHQEEYMAEAWLHARNTRSAQRELRQSRLAYLLGGNLQTRLSQLSNESWLQISSPTHRRTILKGEDKAIASSISASRLIPNGVFDSGFRRLAFSQQRKLKKYWLSTGSDAKGLSRSVTKNCMDGTLEVRELALTQSSSFLAYKKSYSVEDVSQLSPTAIATRRKINITGTIMDSLQASSNAVFIPVTAQPLNIPKFIQSPNSKDIDMESIAIDSKNQIDPKQSLVTSIFNRVQGLDQPSLNAVPIPKFAQVLLEFDEPGYKKLQALNPEYFLPGYGDIPPNTVSVLTPNPDFIESYLVGLNHEMSREFAWREYPAELSSTWFRRFWDYIGQGDTRDIEPISEWSKRSKLGVHAHGFRPGEEEDRIVVLIKGDLLRRYPDTVIYAAKAKWVHKQTVTDGQWELYDKFTAPASDDWTRDVDLSKDENIVFPIFMGEIGDDADFIGFDLTLEEIYGSTDKEDNDPGWFIVFEEHMSEPRFGLDVADVFSSKAPTKIQDLSWGHFAENQEALDSLSHVPLSTAWSNTAIEGHQWGETSADIARLSYQLPVRVLFHGDALIQAPRDE